MKEYTLEHKHCKAITKIRGNDIYDALRKNNVNGNVWKVIKEEKIF